MPASYDMRAPLVARAESRKRREQHMNGLLRIRQRQPAVGCASLQLVFQQGRQQPGQAELEHVEPGVGERQPMRQSGEQPALRHGQTTQGRENLLQGGQAQLSGQRARQRQGFFDGSLFRSSERVRNEP